MDCEAAIVQSKLSVDYGELNLRESLPPYILSLRLGEQLQNAAQLAWWSEPPAVLNDRAETVHSCMMARAISGHSWSRDIPVVVPRPCATSRLFTSTAARRHCSSLACEEQSDWLLVTRALLLRGFVPKRWLEALLHPGRCRRYKNSMSATSVPDCSSSLSFRVAMPKGKNQSRADRRAARGARIFASGIEAKRPCSCCKKEKRSCRISLSSESCSECAQRGTRCDLFVSDLKWERLEKNRDLLRAKIEESRREQDLLREAVRIRLEESRREEDRLREAERTAFAAETRLKTQLRFLERREAEFVARDFSSIEDLEELERREAEGSPVTASSSTESSRPAPSDNLPLGGDLDWSLADLPGSPLSLGTVDRILLDASGEIPFVAEGNSGI